MPKPTLGFDHSRLVALHRTYRSAHATFVGHREATRDAREDFSEVQRSASVAIARAADLVDREAQAHVRHEQEGRINRARERLAESEARLSVAHEASGAARTALITAISFAATQGLPIPGEIDLNEFAEDLRGRAA